MPIKPVGNDVLEYPITKQAGVGSHPWPKPLPLFKKLVSHWSLDGHTVLDPFTGSGTTLRAAKDLGRKAIGIEIEEEYCEIAAKRMAQTVMLV
jgi:site-specific DNA-methyltransferase (adenine-specific)